MTRAPAAMSEADYLRRVVDTARLHGWLVTHFRPAPTRTGWATPLQGHAGFPDLALARAGRVLLAELKTDRGRPTPDQRRWLAELGDHGRLWRPADWPDVLTTLTTKD
jgi:hypothetical protein